MRKMIKPWSQDIGDVLTIDRLNGGHLSVNKLQYLEHREYRIRVLEERASTYCRATIGFVIYRRFNNRLEVQRIAAHPDWDAMDELLDYVEHLHDKEVHIWCPGEDYAFLAQLRATGYNIVRCSNGFIAKLERMSCGLQ